MLELYLPTKVRAISYLTGIIVGYLIFNVESGIMKFFDCFKLQIFFWMYSIGHLLSPLPVKFIIDLLNKNLYANVIIEVHARVFWAISIGWIIIGCHFMQNGLINRFLSNKYWIPLGKLGLSIYLVHPILQYNLIASLGTQNNFETFFLVRLKQQSKFDGI